MIVSRCIRRLLSSTAILLWSVGLMAAAHAKSDQACSGKDLLAELKVKSPASHAAIMAAADKIPNGDAILWKIERDGLPVSYLFGTVHLTDKRAHQFSDQTLGALAESKHLALEVADLSPGKTSEAIAASAKYILFADGQRLDKMLEPKEYAFVEQVLKKSGMPTGLAPMFKPWIVTMIMSVPDCEREKVANGELVVDMRLGEEARRLGINVVGLESIESQLSAMAAVPLADQLQILRASLKYIKQTNDLSETVLQLYLNRRISATLPFQAALAKRVGINPDVYKSFTRELLDKRNEKMRDKIIKLVEKDSTFVAIGALHLPGNTGLVAMLREAGFKLTAID